MLDGAPGPAQHIGALNLERRERRVAGADQAQLRVRQAGTERQAALRAVLEHLHAVGEALAALRWCGTTPSSGDSQAKRVSTPRPREAPARSAEEPAKPPATQNRHRAGRGAGLGRKETQVQPCGARPGADVAVDFELAQVVA